MTREQQEELLFEFVEWLRTEYQVEDVYGMYVPEFLDDVVLPQPDVSGAERKFCPSCKNEVSRMQYECKCGYHFMPE